MAAFVTAENCDAASFTLCNPDVQLPVFCSRELEGAQASYFIYSYILFCPPKNALNIGLEDYYKYYYFLYWYLNFRSSFKGTRTVSPPKSRGVELIFNGGHISLAVAFKGRNVILGLCKCNYSLIVK